MEPHIGFVKEKLYSLIQEQLRHKTQLNFVAFNSKVYPWRDRLVDVTDVNLKVLSFAFCLMKNFFSLYLFHVGFVCLISVSISLHGTFWRDWLVKGPRIPWLPCNSLSRTATARASIFSLTAGRTIRRRRSCRRFA